MNLCQFIPELLLTGQVSVRGVRKLIVTNEEEALNLLFEGETNRQIATHLMNANSSRSHTIFTLHLEQRSRVESSEKVCFFTILTGVCWYFE